MVVAGTVIGMPPLTGRLAGGDLAGAGLEHLAHEDVVDLLAGEAGPDERLLDGEATELGGGEPGQGAGQLADRRASAGQDHGTSHVDFPRGVQWLPVE